MPRAYCASARIALLASANTHDSLGEIYDLAGDHARAIDSYTRSLALDPDNHHAAQALARLRTAPP